MHTIERFSQYLKLEIELMTAYNYEAVQHRHAHGAATVASVKVHGHYTTFDFFQLAQAEL